MDTVNLLKLVEKAQKMALSNAWGENAYKINMAILKADHNNCAAYTRLAKYYKLNENFAEAKNMYLKALEINPNHQGAINNLDDIETDQKQNEVVDKFGTSKELFKEGQISMGKSRYKLAEKLFAKAYEIEPLLMYAVNLAGVYKKMDRDDKIEKLYRQLLDDATVETEALNSEFKTLLVHKNDLGELDEDNNTR